MTAQFEGLTHNDVVSIKFDTDLVIMEHRTFRVSEFAKQIAECAISASNSASEWSTDGVACEVLVAGQGWRSGKVRISLEFCPDELVETPATGFPLDELRKSI